MLVEATPERAEELRLIHREVLEREAGIKSVKEEVERERKTQDALLKDTKSFQSADVGAGQPSSRAKGGSSSSGIASSRKRA